MKKIKMSQLKINTNNEGSGMSTPKDIRSVHNSDGVLTSKEDKRILNHFGSLHNKSAGHNGSVSTTNSSIHTLIARKNNNSNIPSGVPQYPKATNKTPLTKKHGSNIISFIKENENRNFPSISRNKKQEEDKFSKLSIQSPKSSLQKLNTGKGIINSPSLSTSKANLSQVTTQTNSIVNSPSLEPSPTFSNTNTHTLQESISVSSLIGNQNIPISLSNLSVNFPFYEAAKCSTKPLGPIRAYAANTYQGIIRNYNEDRVSIILNVSRPQNYFGVWPKCSFFGIYDGHGGSLCSDFLRDQLHTYVIKDENFPLDPVEALKKGFEKAESDFIVQHALSKNYEIVDKSGSCAVIALVIEDLVYVANVGDSRAVLSINGGKDLRALSNDHKPNEEGENKRILKNGGRVYQTQTPTKLLNIPNNGNPNQILLGPHRVSPGRLSVSRTFGDVEAKLSKFGGMPGVVIASPEIEVFKITDDCDFMVLGCDGIFDQLSNKDALESVWMTMNQDTISNNIHSQVALGADMIMKTSLVRRTLDNVTVLVISFKNFENIFNDGFKNKNFSPKSSFYLYHVIENKEHLMTDINNCYCNTEPQQSGKINPLVDSQSKIMRARIRKIQLDEITQLRKVKSISPQNKEQAHNPSEIKLNKVLSFDLSKKAVISPKYRKVVKQGNETCIVNSGNSNKINNSRGKNLSLKFSENKSLSNLFKKIQN